jgi:hypothetical protein
LTWNAPWNGGATITSYTVTWQHSDGTTYSEDITICDGSLAGTISTRTCTIANTIFTQDPFYLEWGSSIYTKVYATNVKGDSVLSLAGNGAEILRVPDVPTDLVDILSITAADQIGFSWQDGSNDGGTAVIDYLVAYAGTDGVYSTLEVGVIANQHAATGLTAGTTYSFKV